MRSQGNPEDNCSDWVLPTLTTADIQILRKRITTWMEHEVKAVPPPDATIELKYCAALEPLRSRIGSVQKD
jgi:hypothetical protein